MVTVRTITGRISDSYNSSVYINLQYSLGKRREIQNRETPSPPYFMCSNNFIYIYIYYIYVCHPHKLENNVSTMEHPKSLPFLSCQKVYSQSNIGESEAENKFNLHNTEEKHVSFSVVFLQRFLHFSFCFFNFEPQCSHSARWISVIISQKWNLSAQWLQRNKCQPHCTKMEPTEMFIYELKNHWVQSFTKRLVLQKPNPQKLKANNRKKTKQDVSCWSTITCHQHTVCAQIQYDSLCLLGFCKWLRNQTLLHYLILNCSSALPIINEWDCPYICEATVLRRVWSVPMVNCTDVAWVWLPVQHVWLLCDNLYKTHFHGSSSSLVPQLFLVTVTSQKGSLIRINLF